jgi:hypothetical protein
MSIRSAMARAIHDETGLRAYDHFPSNPAVPCVAILPDDPVVDYHESMGLSNGLMKINLNVIIMASQTSDRAGEQTISDYLGTEDGTILAAFFNDPTLDGTCEDVVVREATAYGQMTVANSVLATVRLKTEVRAR